MEVILTQNVDKLGHRGSIVRVADGYARNYLLPKGFAITATKGARKQAEDIQRSEQRREQHRRDAAMTERDKVHGRAVTVKARANAEGKLYGSITPKDVAEALRETHGVIVEPDRCHLEEHIRTTGVFTFSFNYYKDIAAEVTVTVKATEDSGAEAPAAEAEEGKRAPKPKAILPDSD